MGSSPSLPIPSATGPQTDLKIPSSVLASNSSYRSFLASQLGIFLDLASIDRAFNKEDVSMNELKRRVWKFLGSRRPCRISVAQRVETGLTILGGIVGGNSNVAMLHRVADGDGEGHSEVATLNCSKTPLCLEAAYTKSDGDLEDMVTDGQDNIYFLCKNRVYRMTAGAGAEATPVEVPTDLAILNPDCRIDYIRYYNGMLYLYDHSHGQLWGLPATGGACKQVYAFDADWPISAFDVRNRHGRYEILSCSNDSNDCIHWMIEGESSPKIIDVPYAARCRFLDHPTANLAVVGCSKPCGVRIIDLDRNEDLCCIDLPEAAKSVCSVVVNSNASQIYITEWRVQHTFVTQMFVHYYTEDSQQLQREASAEEPLVEA
ncbi:hypothetical protein FOL47_000106 [Perkinsus chesapeaki]|uniref:Uncharacterized protein n=1 Tax=Perkinsus chesapeaki TaxID=330153 RepID=A0A7J6N1P7_PERCH|nr:hypothetical protein FOL47_000106 [Perkinsus chesapeaki]